MGIDQRPLGTRLPVMMTLFAFSILTSYFPKMAMQSSSHSCAREMRVPVARSSNTNADWAGVERAGERGSVPCRWVCMGVPLAERTVGPLWMAVV